MLRARIFKYSAIFLLLTIISGCDLLGRTLEQEDMNVYFYKPDGEELYLGVVRGITLCRSTVLERAKLLSLDGNGGMPANPGKNEKIAADESNTSGPGWTYHCCWKTVTQTCKEKLK